MPNSFIRDVREVLRRLRNRGIELDGNRQYPAIPTIDDTIESHTNALRAIREALETHERRNPRAALDSFVRLYELEDVLGGFQQGESSVTNIYNTGTTVEFATPEETDAGTLETKAIHPFGGAYAYDRLRWPGQHTAGKGTATVTLVPNSGVVVIDGDLSNVFEITLDADVHFDDPINLKSGQTYNVLIAQDSIGGHVATYGASWTFVNQIDPVLTETADAVDLLSCQWHASAGKTRAVLLPNYGAGYVVPPVYDIADFQFINLGGGNEVVIGKDQYDPELYFRTIVGEGDVSVSTVDNTIVVSYTTPEAVDYSGVPFLLFSDPAEWPGLPEARQLVAGSNILIDTSDMYGEATISCIAPGLPPEGTTGQVLRKLSDTDYDASWTDLPDGAVNLLADLEDVDIYLPADGDVLTYDSTYGVWVPGTASTVAAIGDLTDVDLTGLTDGDTIVYDATYGMWMPGAGSAVAALNDLTDVTAPAPVTNDVLRYNGSAWVNGSPNTDDISYVNDGCMVRRTGAAQSIPAATDTAIIFDTENRDDNGYWSSGTPTRITIPASGWYVIAAKIRYNAAATSGGRWLWLVKNGSTRLASSSQYADGHGYAVCAPTAVEYLQAGDYIEAVAYQGTASPISLYTPDVNSNEPTMSIHRLGTHGGSNATYLNDGCEVTRAATQAVAATTWTEVAFDTEIRDDNSYWTNANSSRFTAPASGWYAVSFSVSFDTASAQCSLFIGKNGSSSTTSNRVAGTLPAAAVASSRHSLSCITYLAAGDYLLFEVYSSAITNIISGVPARAAIHRLGTPSEAPTPYNDGCTVTRTTDQTTTAADFTVVSFNTEVRDDNSYWSADTPTQLTIPASGWYAITGSIHWGGTSTLVTTYITKNGSASVGANRLAASTTNTSAANQRQNVSAVAYLAAGDYVRLEVYSSASSTVNGASVPAAFSIHRLGAAVGTSAEGCMLRRLANAQTVANSTWIAVTWDTEVQDDEGYFSVAANDRVTIPVSGWYACNGSVAWDSTTTGSRLIAVLVNGDSSNQFGRAQYVSTSSGFMTATAFIYLTAGQYVQLAVFQDSGGTRTLSITNGAPKFSIVRIAGFPRGTGGTADNVSFDDTNAALGGTNIQDTLDILADQLRTSGGHVRASGAYVYRGATAQTISNITTTALTFDTEVRDDEGYVNLGANNDRFVIPVTGWYALSGNVTWDSSTAGTIRILALSVNGSNTGLPITRSVGIASNLQQNVSGLLYLTAGDYVQLVVYHDSGSSRTLYNPAGFNHPSFSIVRLEGKSDVQDSGLEFVGEAVVTGAAATSMTLSGLDLDADEIYEFELSFDNATASTGTVSMFVEGDTTATNYDRVIASYGSGGTYTNNANLVGLAASDSHWVQGSMTRDLEGRARVLARANYDVDANLSYQDIVWRYRTSSNVTSITITSSVASSLAIGSFLRVWRRRRITTTPRTAVQAADLVITSNAVLQNTDLAIVLTPGTYSLEAFWRLLSHATPDMEIQFAFDGTATLFEGELMGGTGSTPYVNEFTSLSSVATYAATATYRNTWDGVITVTVGGTLRLKARQVTSSATPVTFYKGAWMRAQRLN